MNIIPYQEQYKQDFIELNTAWIEAYFTMEQEDRDILFHVDDLLQTGSMIFFAVEDGRVLATCMAMPTGGDVWEICKLAAREQDRQRGAGGAVFQACMEYAIAHGAKKLTLISNHILEPALHLYQKFGFHRVPIDQANKYERCDVQCEYIVPQT